MTYHRKDHPVPGPTGQRSRVSAGDVEAEVLDALVMDEVRAPSRKLSRLERFKRKMHRRRTTKTAVPTSTASDEALATARATLRQARRASAHANRFSPVPEAIRTLADVGDELLRAWPDIEGDPLLEYDVTSLLGPDLAATLDAFEGREGADADLVKQLGILTNGARALIERTRFNGRDRRSTNGLYLADKYEDPA